MIHATSYRTNVAAALRAGRLLPRGVPRQYAIGKIGRRLLVALLLLAAFAAGARNSAADSDFADQVRIDTSISSSEVHVAEPFDVQVNITAPVGTRLVFPPLGEQLGDFEVLDHHDTFDIPGDHASDVRTWTRRLTLESLITGGLEVPEMEFRASAAGKSQVLYSKPGPVRVLSVLEDRADPTRFRDIQSVIDVTVPASPRRFPVGWVVGIVGGVGLLIAAAAVVTRRKTWLSPREWALQELQRLNAEAQSSPGPVVAQELSAVLREYIDLQFNIAAPVQTTAELLAVLEEHTEPSSADRLGALLNLADEAKFAGLNLTTAQLTSAIEESRQLVDQLARANEETVHTNDTGDRETH